VETVETIEIVTTSDVPGGVVMPPIDMTIEGGEELLKEIKRLGIDVEAMLKAAVLRGAEVIADAANERAPGPHNGVEVDKESKGSVTVNIGPDEDHWYYRFFETGAGRHEK
jgi:hypothetical protein